MITPAEIVDHRLTGFVLLVVGEICGREIIYVPPSTDSSSALEPLGLGIFPQQ